MEKLVEALSADYGNHIREKEFLNEAIHWLRHIDFIVSLQRFERDLSRRSFLLNDVTTNYCALLNWLSLVNLVKTRVSNGEIGNLINQNFNWPADVAEVFMNCVRNPTMHMGRAHIWGEYEANWSKSKLKHGDDADFRGAFDPNITSVGFHSHPSSSIYNDYINSVHDVGFYQSQSVSDQQLVVETKFFFLGFRKNIEALILTTFDKLKTMTIEEKEEFEKIIMMVSLTQMPAPENGG